MKFTKENYEEFALDYFEGNLDTVDRIQFEIFLEANPKLKESIDEFELVVLPPFMPVMPNKSKLYHNNSRIKPIAFYIKGIAAAILILVLLSTVLIQLDRQPINAIVHQQSTYDKIEYHMPTNANVSKEKSEVILNHPDDKVSVSTAGRSQGIAVVNKDKKPRAPVLSESEISEYIENFVLETPEENDPDRSSIRTVALIDKIDIKPNFHLEYKLEYRPNFLLIENEEIQDDAFSKIGRLLARANLIPTGLQDEFEEASIREKMIPETYVDLK